MQSIFKSESSKEDILFTEQFFDNYELFKAYQHLSEKQKLVLYMKYVFDLSEPYIAAQLCISKQAVAKRNHAALNILLTNYNK